MEGAWTADTAVGDGCMGTATAAVGGGQALQDSGTEDDPPRPDDDTRDTTILC